VIADPLDAELVAAALTGTSAVVHLAGRAHVLHERSVDPLVAFRRVNVEGSKVLAEAALRAGVGHVVFISSIAAAAVTSEVPVDELFPPAPSTPYGISKLEAEQVFLEAASGAGMRCTILRPPMVIGLGMRGNPRTLLRLIARGVPLPLGGVGGKRSMLGVENLAAAIAYVIASPPPTGVYHLADHPPMTVAEFAVGLGTGLGRSARIVSVPFGLLVAMARLGDVLAPVLPTPLTSDRLARAVGPLIVDSRKFAAATGYTPAISLDEAVRRSAMSPAPDVA
jgi:nucleoside-diphosphate-sugar epimerase